MYVVDRLGEGRQIKSASIGLDGEVDGRRAGIGGAISTSLQK